MVGRARQANVEGGRPARHEVLLTAEQKERIAVAAKLAGPEGMSIPRFLVESTMASLDGEAPTDRRALLVELNLLTSQVAKVGVNINQIARVANATGELDEDLSRSLSQARAVIARINAILDAHTLEPGAVT